MPIYEYQCEFGHTYEESQSIKEYKTGQTRECPECGNIMERVIGEPILATVDNGPSTIGQLGERNFKALGKIKGQEMIEKSKERKKLAEDEFCRSKGLDPNQYPNYKKLNKLANLNKEQQKKYIETGKLPPGKGF